MGERCQPEAPSSLEEADTEASEAGEKGREGREEGKRARACGQCRSSHTACDGCRPCCRCLRIGKADECKDVLIQRRRPKANAKEAKHDVLGKRPLPTLIPAGSTPLWPLLPQPFSVPVTRVPDSDTDPSTLEMPPEEARSYADAVDGRVLTTAATLKAFTMPEGSTSSAPTSPGPIEGSTSRKRSRLNDDDTKSLVQRRGMKMESTEQSTNMTSPLQQAWIQLQLMARSRRSENDRRDLVSKFITEHHRSRIVAPPAPPWRKRYDTFPFLRALRFCSLDFVGEDLSKPLSLISVTTSKGFVPITVWANRSYCEIHGYSKEEMIGMNVHQITLVNLAGKKFFSLVRGPPQSVSVPYSIQLRHVHKQERAVCMECRVQFCYGRDGNAMCGIWVVDRSWEEELQEKERKNERWLVSYQSRAAMHPAFLSNAVPTDSLEHYVGEDTMHNAVSISCT